ncbi:HyaD/HybD family hydrogenase maturation endopeptidase [Salisediminibacterium beveridgei]|uniref:Hydrogenase maturation protease n=1 Tax=Salisediminibacterium beveridgei TaxID=632773 RepID=A0A1D7QXD4_9BACI|nr:HyaD/HybD family hydrogenase maturation endopeptidase [Salisediminibacterium beveridgei]AOM83676.1 Hydrogenase maturation protease [Salisediminibacterium beveridgei]
MSQSEKPIKVIGLGNFLYRDEGLGIHILPDMIRLFEEDADVEVIEGSTDGLRLLEPVEQAKGLLIIDAIADHQPPGSVIILEGDDLPDYFSLKMSMHQLGFQEVLQVAELKDCYPEKISIVGIQPESLVMGTELTESVQQSIPELMDVIRKKVTQWKREWHESSRLSQRTSIESDSNLI